MGIVRRENITVNLLSFGINAFGEQSTTQTVKFATGAVVQNVSNTVMVSDKYRVYQDMVQFILSYTPNTKAIVDNQKGYSITYRAKDWRIVDVKESNDRMNVTLLCSYNEPGEAV
jgi:hypothetical protein